MMKSFITLLLTILISVCAESQQTTHHDTGKVLYLCPPCGLDCDTVHFDRPGACPTCGMKLFASYSGYENVSGDHHDYCDKKVAVLLFPGVEIIDFSGPWEVFGAAGMEVFSVTADGKEVVTTMGLTIKPDYAFADAPSADILLVPGGSVNPSDTAVTGWIARTSKQTAHTMSVCTGAFYLAAAALLDSMQATTNFHATGALRAMSPGTTVLDNVRYTDNGKIITAGGLSAGIDAALHLVAGYLGHAQTKMLALELEYDWSDTDPFVRGKMADKYLPDILNVFTPFDYKLIEYTGDYHQWRAVLDVKTTLKQDELLRILAIQTTDITGASKSKKSNTWIMEENGKRWETTLKTGIAGPDMFRVTIGVSVE